MAIAGLRGTGDWGTDERPKNFREMILWRDPNGDTPLTALMAKMRKETTDDPEFAWWEEEQKPARVKVAAIAVTTATSITLDTTEDADALDLVAGDLLLVEKNVVEGAFGFEILEVSANPTVSTTLTVSRGAAGTTANTASIATNTYLLKIGSAFEEGTGAKKASTRNPQKYSNYTQIFKDTYDLTGTALETKARTGDPLKNDKKRKMFDHSSGLEYAAIFGYPYETTGSGGKPKRYTGGLLKYLGDHYNATNSPTIKVWTTTAVTEDDILDATSPMFDFTGGGVSNERIGLCGNGFLNYLNKIAKNSSSTRINYDGTIKLYGMQLSKWIIPQGTLYMRSHPLFNVNSRFTNGALFINPAGITYRPLRNRDTKFMDNIQNNDEDRRKGQWLTEAGFEFHHLRTMLYAEIQV